MCEVVNNCSICGDKIEGFGNNAEPFNGICCDQCNMTIVVPQRLNEMLNQINK